MGEGGGHPFWITKLVGKKIIAASPGYCSYSRKFRPVLLRYEYEFEF